MLTKIQLWHNAPLSPLVFIMLSSLAFAVHAKAFSLFFKSSILYSLCGNLSQAAELRDESFVEEEENKEEEEE